MDKLQEAKIEAIVVRTIEKTLGRILQEKLEGADEVWLRPKQLLEQFGMFSKDWLERNGELLPREYASVIYPDGKEVSTRFVYPKHKMNRMIQEGKLKGLRKA